MEVDTLMVDWFDFRQNNTKFKKLFTDYDAFQLMVLRGKTLCRNGNQHLTFLLLNVLFKNENTTVTSNCVLLDAFTFTKEN